MGKNIQLYCPNCSYKLSFDPEERIFLCKVCMSDFHPELSNTSFTLEKIGPSKSKEQFLSEIIPLSDQDVHIIKDKISQLESQIGAKKEKWYRQFYKIKEIKYHADDNKIFDSVILHFVVVLIISLLAAFRLFASFSYFERVIFWILIFAASMIIIFSVMAFIHKNYEEKLDELKEENFANLAEMERERVLLEHLIKFDCY